MSKKTEKYMNDLQRKLIIKYNETFGIDLGGEVRMDMTEDELKDFYVKSYLFWEDQSPKVYDERTFKEYTWARQLVCLHYIKDIIKSAKENNVFEDVMKKVRELKEIIKQKKE